MLARLGHKVLRLRRVAIGPVPLGHLAPGKARPLAGAALERLRRVAERAGDPGRHGEGEEMLPRGRRDRAGTGGRHPR